MICLQRNTIELMVTALLANKKIIDSKGNCAFCRNKKQHEEEKWCAGRTKLQLFLVSVIKTFNTYVVPKKGQAEDILRLNN